MQHHELAVNNRLSRKVDSFARRIREGINALNFEQRQTLVRMLVEQVRVTGPSVQIHLRIPLDEPSSADDLPSDPNSTKVAGRRPSNQLRLRSLGGDLAEHPGPQAPAARQLPLSRRPAEPGVVVHRLLQPHNGQTVQVDLPREAASCLTAHYGEFVQLERLKMNSQFGAKRTLVSAKPNGAVCQRCRVKQCRCRWWLRLG